MSDPLALIPKLKCSLCKGNKLNILFPESERKRPSPRCCQCLREYKQQRKPNQSHRPSRWTKHSMAFLFAGGKAAKKKI